MKLSFFIILGILLVGMLFLNCGDSGIGPGAGSVAPGPWQATVSGDVNATLSGSAIWALNLQGRNKDLSIIMLSEFNEKGPNDAINIIGGPFKDKGTYQIEDFLSEEGFVAGYTRVTSEPFEILGYGSVSGTLNITAVSENRLEEGFNFTARGVDGEGQTVNRFG